MQIKYWVSDQETEDDAVEIHVCDGSEWERCAERAAEHFHNCRDGYNRSWPVEIAVRIGGIERVYSVLRESVPVFRAVSR
ncbi:MAG: hypothetical protein MUF25_15985 [Pirellulaceae bacterium]|jgi:hypothetical protein|nr:hypothetical protein [Pirellulaceae bacterium]